MEEINAIFQRIEKFITLNNSGITPMLPQSSSENATTINMININVIFTSRRRFLYNIFKEIDNLASYIKNDETLLISVKNQKLLRSCFHLIVSHAISPCLVPGLGMSLSIKSSLVPRLPALSLSDISDEQKYVLLTDCIDFFIRCYSVPVLKNIIFSFHLSDYLAALIQLSFAPLKKPGVYENFTMTEEMYGKLTLERKKYVKVYDHLVSNCFQPTLMKELLVLQNISNTVPPAFVKRVLTKQLSRQLIAPRGLLSLIRCLMDNLEFDTGIEWRKIDIICKLIAAKHGNTSDLDYLQNVCNQLRQILVLNNTQYLTIAVACLMTLNKKYQDFEAVTALTKEVFGSFSFDNVLSESNLPGTVILTTQQINNKLQIFHSSLTLPNQEMIVKLLTPNLPLLFLLAVKCTNKGTKDKLNEIIIKCMEKLKVELPALIKFFLFGDTRNSRISVEEFEAGLIVKAVNNYSYPLDDALLNVIDIFQQSSGNHFIKSVIETSLQMLIDLSVKRSKINKEQLSTEDEPMLLNDIDRQYVNILQLLSVISETFHMSQYLKTSPETVLNFIEYFLKENKQNNECETIALILLNTILPNIDDMQLNVKLRNFVPILEKISSDESNTNSILSKEAMLLINGGEVKKDKSPYEKAVVNVLDNLLPTRAHGIMELTKLIDAHDPETISKRHLVFCLFKEQLECTDSYIYLAAINGISALAMHCTEDVITVLCREFLNIQTASKDIETEELLNKTQEMRMKLGDIIVKVTKRLGDMSIAYRTTLLNTMLTACKDDDPFIKASALSNLAEIALVLHYRLGSIIHEILLCIGSIIITERAVECRRAAVMVISSLLKGLGRNMLVQLKESLVPMYRILIRLHKDPDEDDAIKLHAQIGLEELNDVVQQFLFPNLAMEKPMSLSEPKEIVYK